MQYVPIIDIPLTAALELLIVPIAMKQSSDPAAVWARGGTDTITVSDTMVLFSACDFMFKEEQFQ